MKIQKEIHFKNESFAFAAPDSDQSIFKLTLQVWGALFQRSTEGPPKGERSCWGRHFRRAEAVLQNLP